MSEMNAIQAVRSGRIPVLTSGIAPAAMAKKMLPSLAQAWKEANAPEANKLVHIATPEDGSFNSFLRGTATTLLRQAEFRNRFPGLVALEVTNADNLTGNMLLALLEAITKLSDRHLVMFGRKEDAPRLVSSVMKFGIPALIRLPEEAAPRSACEQAIREAAERLGVKFSGTLLRQIADAVFPYRDLPGFAPDLLIRALSQEQHGLISGVDLKREQAETGYIAMCAALAENVKAKPRQIGFYNSMNEKGA